MCVFITAVPITKLFARGGGGSGGYVLRETTSRGLCELVCPFRTGTREEPCTLTQGGAPFSLVPLVWESNPKLQGGFCKPNHQPIGGGVVCPSRTSEHEGEGYCVKEGSSSYPIPNPDLCVCVFITAGPIIKLFAGGEGAVKDICYEVRRAEVCVD